MYTMYDWLVWYNKGTTPRIFPVTYEFCFVNNNKKKKKKKKGRYY